MYHILAVGQTVQTVIEEVNIAQGHACLESVFLGSLRNKI
jgi:hypothetical protein